jgi:broad specificity phosphatase PhoE
LSTRVLLLRHAETAEPGRFHGCESDVGLSPRGHAQARAAAARYARETPAVVVSSGLLRARDTARPIAEACAVEHRVVEPIHERRMGHLARALREDGWATYDEGRRRWAAGELDWTHEGGESYAQIHARVVPAFEAIAADAIGRTAVVVAHGVVIRVLLTSLVAGLSPADFTSIPIDYVVAFDLRRDHPDGPWTSHGRIVPDDADIEAGAW